MSTAEFQIAESLALPPEARRRIAGYDVIRSFAILTVFLCHILEPQTAIGAPRIVLCSLSPGLTMSLLGFISAALLSKNRRDYEPFLVRRFTRVYVSLLLCLSFVLVFHACLGKQFITQHTLLHLVGLSVGW